MLSSHNIRCWHCSRLCTRPSHLTQHTSLGDLNSLQTPFTFYELAIPKSTSTIQNWAPDPGEHHSWLLNATFPKPTNPSVSSLPIDCLCMAPHLVNGTTQLDNPETWNRPDIFLLVLHIQSILHSSLSLQHVCVEFLLIDQAVCLALGISNKQDR